MTRLINEETGQYEEVPAGAVVDALRSGTYSMEEGQEVDVVTDTGQFGKVDAMQLGTLIAGGGRMASDEEVAKAEQARIYGTTGQQAIGAAEAVGRGLLPGFSALETEVLGVEGEGIRAREAELGDAAMAIELGTGVGSLLLPGGILAKAGKVGEVAKVATAVPRGIARVGQGIEEVSQAALTRALAGREALGAKAIEVALPKALGGAFEAGVWGAGEALNEEALAGGNYNQLAERLVAHMGPAALIGGTITGAAGLGTHAASAAGKKLTQGWEKLTSKDIGEVVSRQLGYAVPDATASKLKDWYAKVSGIASGAGEDNVRRLLEKDVRQMALNGAELKATATRDLTEALGRVIEVEDITRSVAAGELKAAMGTAKVKRGKDTVRAAMREIRNLRDDAADMLTTSGQSRFGSDAKVSRIRDAIEILESQAKKVAKGAEPEAKMFRALDNTKRELDSYVVNAKRSIQAQQDPIARMQLEAYQEHVRRMGDRIRGHLEDANVWGEAGEVQKRVNSKFHSALGPENDAFNANMVKRERGFDRDVKVVDMEKVGRYVDSLKDYRKDRLHQQLRGNLTARRELLETILDNYDLPPAQTKKLREAAEATKHAGGVLDSAAETISAENVFKEVIDAEGRAGIGSMVGIGAGALAGGPLGAIAGAALGAITRPGHTLRQLAFMESMAGSVKARTEAISKALVRAREAGGRALKAVAPPKASRMAPVVAKLFEGDTEERKAAALEHAKEMRRLASNPMGIADRVNLAIGDAQTFAPQTTVALHAAAARLLQNIAANAPPLVDFGAFPQWHKQTISEGDAEQFAYYTAGAEAPIEALEEQIESGNVNAHTVRAVKENYPEVFAGLQQDITDDLSALEEEPDYQTLVMLGSHFEIETTATLRPGYIARTQEMHAAAAQPAPPPPAKAGMANDFDRNRLTEAQRLSLGE